MHESSCVDIYSFGNVLHMFLVKMLGISSDERCVLHTTDVMSQFSAALQLDKQTNRCFRLLLFTLLSRVMAKYWRTTQRSCRSKTPEYINSLHGLMCRCTCTCSVTLLNYLSWNSKKTVMGGTESIVSNIVLKHPPPEFFPLQRWFFHRFLIILTCCKFVNLAHPWSCNGFFLYMSRPIHCVLWRQIKEVRVHQRPREGAT